MKNVNAALLIITALVFNSCGSLRRPLKPQVAPVIANGQGWVAAEQTPDTFLLIYVDNVAQTEAMKQLCSKEYICFNGYIGEAMTISRKRKETK